MVKLSHRLMLLYLAVTVGLVVVLAMVVAMVVLAMVAAVVDLAMVAAVEVWVLVLALAALASFFFFISSNMFKGMTLVL